MENFLETPLDNNEAQTLVTKKGKVLYYSILSVFICMCLVVLYDNEYGFMLFIGVPLSIGFTLGFHKTTPIRNVFTLLSKILGISIVITLLLILFGVEGGICIIMITAPLYILLLVSYSLGYFIKTKNSYTQKPLLFSLFWLNPFLTFLDIQSNVGQTYVVHDAVVIQAKASKIWVVLTKKVVYDTPDNFFFKNGVNYPKDMLLVSKNDSSYLSCNLRNGNTKLSIIQCIADSVLKFAPNAFILPIKELTPYKKIHTPHSHNAYFKIDYGAFYITQLDEKSSLLRGETSVTHHLRPFFYWNLWNKYILSTMHSTVLQKIKENAESTK